MKRGKESQINITSTAPTYVSPRNETLNSPAKAPPIPVNKEHVHKRPEHGEHPHIKVP
jgi:hypothetical protein